MLQLRVHSHGHCGKVVNGDVDNDATWNGLPLRLSRIARAGADIVAPSDMMDGRVAAIRTLSTQPVLSRRRSWLSPPSSRPYFMGLSEKPPSPRRSLGTAAATSGSSQRA
jgi:porphobilinogen synthase